MTSRRFGGWRSGRRRSGVADPKPADALVAGSQKGLQCSRQPCWQQKWQSKSPQLSEHEVHSHSKKKLQVPEHEQALVAPFSVPLGN